MILTAGKASIVRKRNFRLKWARPYCAASPGMEPSLIRVLDDLDEPCYTGNTWTMADKNRFHQERAPGGTKKYVRNPALWCYAFRDSMTAASIACDYAHPGAATPNEGWICKRGVVAITPRHIASCGHEPIGMSVPGFPARVRFIGKDGETYDRTLIGRKYCFSTSTVLVNGVNHAWDSWVGTLDEDLPAAVHIARTIPNHDKFKPGYGRWDNLYITQSTENESAAPIGNTRQYGGWPPYTNIGTAYTVANSHTYHPQYSSYHRTMAVPNAWVSHYGDEFLYYLWNGDSGMPLFYAFDTELLWAGFAGGGGHGPNDYPYVQAGVTITWEDLVTAMIDASDDNAIALGYGTLTERTGYRCVFANEIPDLIV